MTPLRWIWEPDRYWPAYLIATAILFIIREVTALASGRSQDTLSDFAWHKLGLPLRGGPILFTAAWYFSFAAWLVVAVFLTIHIWFVKLR